MIHSCADYTCLNNNQIGVCKKYYGKCKYIVRKNNIKKIKNNNQSPHRR